MSADSKFFISVGCLMLASAGALAAFGFHGPADILTPEKRASWAWAVEMQFYHGGGLLIVGILADRLGKSWFIRAAGLLMIAGILIFSGLIYGQTLGLSEAFGQIVPSGGSMMMLSWLALAVGVLTVKR